MMVRERGVGVLDGQQKWRGAGNPYSGRRLRWMPPPHRGVWLGSEPLADSFPALLSLEKSKHFYVADW
ncbi:hypothetical protein HanPI659440_Chr10g0366681 [Helianthus annuus]|nr:hypothetical protein HanPI659440_Chr10g0366681 [Helianthus annuus]